MTIGFSRTVRGLRALAAALLGGAAVWASVGAAAEPAAPVLAALVQTEEGATLALRFAAPEPPDFRIAALDAPPRIVIDLEGAGWAEGAPEVARGPGVASGVRFGLVSPGWSRAVIDLARPALPRRAETFADPSGGARLTLDLAPTEAAAFAAFAALAPAAPPTAGPRAPAPGRGMVVALDPGHGGEDPGATRGGVVEKDVVLAFSRDLAAALEAEGFRVVLTRETDVFVALPDRVARARAAGAAVLLSIHADALPAGGGEASGASVYVLSAEASDAEAELLAARENQVDRLAGAALLGDGPDVARALIDLVQRDTAAASQRLGAALIAGVGARAPLLAGRPLRAAGFRVLKAPDIPSALVEIGFLSSPVDRARLADPAWRAAAAGGIADGLRAWAAETSRAPQVAATTDR